MSNASPSFFVKSPNAKLDYGVNWGDNWLGTDTIATVTWTVPTGITNVATSFTDDIATIWLSGGTSGQSYDVKCKITTAGGRIDERTITILIRDT